MKISYNTHPALKKLKDGTLGVLALPSDGIAARMQFPDMFYDLNQVFKQKASLLKGNIFHVSNAFYVAAEKAYQKLSLLYLEMIKSSGDFEQSKVFILNDFVIFFLNKFSDEEDSFEVFYLLMTKDGVALEFYCLDKAHENQVKGWSSSAINDGLCSDQDSVIAYLQTRVVNLATLCMFIKYAEVETKVVLGKAKRRFGDPYRNDTDFPITHLNSKWFTTLVRSEGFSVRGHFRLQPKKVNGEWTKELIWINEFEKSGYTSKAKILSTQ